MKHGIFGEGELSEDGDTFRQKLLTSGVEQTDRSWYGVNGLERWQSDFFMSKNYWLVKQEPESYSWATFVKDGKTAWTGVRNYQARNNLRAMKKSDPVFYYHSGEEKQIVGLARVEREAYADPTGKEGDWSAVDLTAVKALAKPVTLATIKSDKALKDMLLVRNSRLSVSPVSEAQYHQLMNLAGG